MKKIVHSLKLSIIAFIITTLISLNTIAADPAYEPMANYHPTSIFAQVGQPVGRLRTQTSHGPSGCTAFLISPTHLMTNEHCVGKRGFNRKKRKYFARTVHKVEVEMNAVDPNNQSWIETYSVLMPPLEINEKLDYAILKVDPSIAEKYGYLSISADTPQYKTPLWIIGHPKLLPQQISRLTCRIIKHPKPHRNRLHHTCPTIGGNSGSPLFNANTSKVIAIHHASYSFEKTGVGLAVAFHVIAKQSPLLRKIIAAQ